MPSVELRREGAVAYREALPDAPETGRPVVLLHGYPESSRMWVPLMEALARAGRRSVAPDLYGLGDSADEGPATFECNLEAFTDLHRELGLGRIAVVVHDWGGFIGLAWACEHADEVEALVISDTGFFSDGRWHGPAEAIRGEHGEAIVAAIDRGGFANLLRSMGGDAFDEEDIDAYWRPFEQGARAAGDARLLPLDGLLQARAVPGEARRARRADAAALGGRGRVRPARRRPALRARDPRLGPRRARGRRPLRLRRAAATLCRRGSRLLSSS